ncbi:hypothetical protein LTR46_007028 [Exophiala xenobiotica]|nr:hypothetical protein LTR46_007028 [Exophiala xenobiotica]
MDNLVDPVPEPTGPPGPSNPATFGGQRFFNLQAPRYGAKADGTTDDSDAIDMWLSDVLAAATDGRRAVAYAPSGLYNHTRLPRVRNYAGDGLVTVQGDGPRATLFNRVNGSFGPAWWFGKERDTSPVFPVSLIPGAPAAHRGFTMSSQTEYWINLSDAPAAQGNQLVGSSTMTVAAWMQPATSQPGGGDNGHVVSSYGKKNDCSDPVTSMFSLWCNGSFGPAGSNQVQFRITTTVGSFTVTSSSGLRSFPSLSYVEGVYDGTHIYLKIDGSVVSPLVPATGNLVRDPFETTTIGVGCFNAWPYGNPSAGAWDGTVYSCSADKRVSATVEAPNSPPSFSAGNTQFLLNFESPVGLFCQGYDANGSLGDYQLYNWTDPNEQISGIQVLNCGFQGNFNQSGLFVDGCINALFSNIHIHVNGKYGIRARDNSYFSCWDKIDIYQFPGQGISDQGHAGIAWCKNAGYCATRVNVNTGALHGYVMQDTGMRLTDCFISPEDHIASAVYANRSEVSLEGFLTDFEGNGHSALAVTEFCDCNRVRIAASVLTFQGQGDPVPLVKWRAVNLVDLPSNSSLSVRDSSLATNTRGGGAVVDVDVVNNGVARLHKLTVEGNSTTINGGSVVLADPHSNVLKFTTDEDYIP